MAGVAKTLNRLGLVCLISALTIVLCGIVLHGTLLCLEVLVSGLSPIGSMSGGAATALVVPPVLPYAVRCAAALLAGAVLAHYLSLIVASWNNPRFGRRVVLRLDMPSGLRASLKC